MRPRGGSTSRRGTRVSGDAAGRLHGTGAGDATSGGPGGGLERGLPVGNGGELLGLVSRAPYPARVAGRGRLWTAGVLPGARGGSTAGGQPGMLSDGGEPGDPAAAGSRSGGSGCGDGVRREIGGQRGGQETEPDHRLLRGDGEFFGVLPF